jgi:hypothetical protein|tara:strand:- start:1059 stop:1250 length:192 start_codon:yes stop_codon:yes gene_type:complete
MTTSLKSLRKQVYDIVIYSEGAFNVKELHQMPYYQIQEILEAFTEKHKVEKDAIEAASGKRSF